MTRKLLVFRIYFPILLAFFSVSGCQQNPTQTALPDFPPTSIPEIQGTMVLPNESTQTISPQPTPENEIAFGLTYQESDGNRVLQGKGRVLSQNLIDLPLPDKPAWLVAAPAAGGFTWYAALEDGTIHTIFITNNGMVESQPRALDHIPGAPIAAVSDLQINALITVDDPEKSKLTHPVYLPLSDQRAYITQDGEIRFMDSTGQIVSEMAIHALPDARILRDESDRLLVLSDPTEMYDHAVLGDPLEAESITLLETVPEISLLTRITLDQGEVIEGIAPIWTDMDGDQQREIIVTVSDADQGAGILVLNETGERIAEGPKMGQPYRWRHQIAVANFGPQGEVELAVVRTPHLDGTLEFYRLEGDQLSIVAEFPGITSHTLGSRNLDLAAAGDLDGDGVTELLVLSPDLKEYIAVRHTSQGVEQAWRLPLDGTVSTNPVGALRLDGQTIFGVGRADGVLRLWMP